LLVTPPQRRLDVIGRDDVRKALFIDEHLLPCLREEVNSVKRKKNQQQEAPPLGVQQDQSQPPQHQDAQDPPSSALSLPPGN